jgi:hypothetical protein
MRQGRYADLMPIASRNLSNPLQAHVRKQVRTCSDRTSAVSGNLTISGFTVCGGSIGKHRKVQGNHGDSKTAHYGNAIWWSPDSKHTASLAVG